MSHIGLHSHKNQKYKKRILKKKSEDANARKLMVMIKNAFGKLQKLQKSSKTTRF